MMSCTAEEKLARCYQALRAVAQAEMEARALYLRASECVERLEAALRQYANYASWEPITLDGRVRYVYWPTEEYPAVLAERALRDERGAASRETSMSTKTKTKTTAVPSVPDDWLDWLHDQAATVTYQRDKRGTPLYTVRVGGLRAVTASRLEVCVAALRASRRVLDR